jgi:hypothetical protein
LQLGENWLGNPLLTVLAAARLLRHADENPFATFLAADTYCVLASNTNPAEIEAEYGMFSSKTGTVLDEYAPPVGVENVPDDYVNRMRRHMGIIAWRNWDKFADR